MTVQQAHQPRHRQLNYLQEDRKNQLPLTQEDLPCLFQRSHSAKIADLHHGFGIAYHFPYQIEEHPLTYQKNKIHHPLLPAPLHKRNNL